MEVRHLPLIQCIIDGFISRQSGDELPSFELIHGQPCGSLGHIVIVLDIEIGILGDSYLDVRSRSDLSALDIAVLKVQTHSVAHGDHKAIQHIRRQGDDESGDHIGTEKTAEAHSTCQHGDDLRIGSEIGGKEDYRDEDEERAEEIRIVGDEVDVVVEDHLIECHLRLKEVRHLIIEIEDYGNSQEQTDRKKEGRQKGTYDIPINPP